MTALDIIKKHTLKPDADYSDSWVLAAMREIYTTGFNNGYKKSYDDHVDGFGYEPDLEQKLKELFPEK